jgi:hypothetical protein
LEDASEIFVDTLFPELYDDVLELLKKNVKVPTEKHYYIEEAEDGGCD